MATEGLTVNGGEVEKVGITVAGLFVIGTIVIGGLLGGDVDTL